LLGSASNMAVEAGN